MLKIEKYDQSPIERSSIKRRVIRSWENVNHKGKQVAKMRERVIFHVDVNSAFLSWEAHYRLKVLGEEVDLREIPSAIGGDQEKRRGVILAKSTPAKAFNVQTGEPIVAALRKCPHLTIVRPNFGIYVQYSKALIRLLKEYSPQVEQYSIDEAFVDMTGTEGLYGDLIQMAHTIKDRIYEELGFTVNIGISSNKLLAKMAGDFKKPNLVHTLFPHEIQEKMWPLPVRNLFFVGSKTEQKLQLLGIKTIGDLARADVKLLKQHLKKQGEVIYQYANGIDFKKVEEEAAPNKGYGNSMTIPYDVNSYEQAHLVLLSLCETVGARLRADQVEAGCISVSLVDCDFITSSMQMTLSQGTQKTKDIYTYACQIFKKLWDHKTPIRQLGVHTTKLLDSHHHQMSFFETPKDTRHHQLDEAIDAIRSKYGENAIKRAAFLGSKLDHMAGGLSKEKRTSMTKPQE